MGVGTSGETAKLEVAQVTNRTLKQQREGSSARLGPDPHPGVRARAVGAIYGHEAHGHFPEHSAASDGWAMVFPHLVLCPFILAKAKDGLTLRETASMDEDDKQNYWLCRK